jgi:hypothetical protein
MSHPTSKYVAKEFVASSPEAQTLGGPIQAYTQNLKTEEIQPFLQKYGLQAIKPDEWVPQQLVLDFQQAIANSSVNSGENLVAIGLRLVETLPFPDTTQSIEDAVLAFNGMMKQVFRNVPADENISVQAKRPGYLLVITNLPYAKDAVFGYMWGLAKRYRPSGAQFSVEPVENPNPDDYPGSAYAITWTV